MAQENKKRYTVQRKCEDCSRMHCLEGCVCDCHPGQWC